MSANSRSAHSAFFPVIQSARRSSSSQTVRCSRSNGYGSRPVGLPATPSSHRRLSSLLLKHSSIADSSLLLPVAFAPTNMFTRSWKLNSTGFRERRYSAETHPGEVHVINSAPNHTSFCREGRTMVSAGVIWEVYRIALLSCRTTQQTWHLSFGPSQHLRVSAHAHSK